MYHPAYHPIAHANRWYGKAGRVIRAHKNGWEVRVYAGPDPLTGKKRYLYGRATSERDAKQVEAQLLTQVAQGRGGRTGARTVADIELAPGPAPRPAGPGACSPKAPR